MRFDRELRKPLLALFLLGVAWMAGYAGLPRVCSLVFVSLAGILAVRSTLPYLRAKLAVTVFQVDTLMYAAAGGCFYLGRWEEAVLLLTLFALGDGGRRFALRRAESAIAGMKDLIPDRVTVRDTEGKEREKALAELRRGDEVIIKPHSRISVDGRVLNGRSAVDESTVTGESFPANKLPGDAVFAGTLNGCGLLIVRAEKNAAGCTLARIAALITAARGRKARVQAVTERVERIYVPIVLVATALIVAAPLFIAGLAWHVSFYRAMAFLVAASPCALAIGVPAAILTALARAARSGILIKDGRHLETMASLRAVAFDKTGTITCGQPTVEAVLPAAGTAEEEIIAAAAAVAAATSHPLAGSIVAAAKKRRIPFAQADQIEEEAGTGAKGVVNGEEILLRPRRLVSTDDLPRFAADCQPFIRSGHTLVFVTRSGSLIGAIALKDAARGDAKEAICELRRLGIEHLSMLTGDNSEAARQIAEEAGLDEWHASLMPEEKSSKIDTLLRKYPELAMVGDGINDGPALAQASVGIALHSEFNDLAVDAADVVLMSKELKKLPEAIRISRSAQQIIFQNLSFALFVIAFVAPAAASGAAPLAWAVVFHEGSTVLVVLNALRLLLRPW